MKGLQQFPPRDLERLSAYSDGRLPPSESEVIEARLREEPELRWALAELKATKQSISSLPGVSLPRNFTISLEMAGHKPRPPAYPVLRLATALATVAFTLLVGYDALILRQAGAPSAGEALRSVAPPGLDVQGTLAAVEAPMEEAAAQALGVGEVLGATSSAPSPFDAEAFEPTGTALEKLIAPYLEDGYAAQPTPLPEGTQAALPAQVPATQTSTPPATPTSTAAPPTPSPIPRIRTLLSGDGGASFLRVAEVALGVSAAAFAVLAVWARRHR